MTNKWDGPLFYWISMRVYYIQVLSCILFSPPPPKKNPEPQHTQKSYSQLQLKIDIYIGIS